MANGIDELKDIQLLLSRPFPDPYSIKSDNVMAQVWLKVIENLESRLILANEIHGKKWWNSPRAANANTGSTPLTLHTLQQSILLLDAHIVSHASKPYNEVANISMRQIFRKIIEFKLVLCVEPAYRLMFESIIHGITMNEKTDFPEISVLPNASHKKRQWYKYYANYKAVMQLIHFHGKALPSLTFERRWIQEDEGVVIALFSYCIACNNKAGVKKLLHQSEQAMIKFPSLKQIHAAMTVY